MNKKEFLDWQFDVLHISPGFYPAHLFGGPSYTTKAICEASSKKYRIKVMTTDVSGEPSGQPLGESGKTKFYNENFLVHYFKSFRKICFSFDYLLYLNSQVAKAKLVHLTSVYNFTTLPTIILCSAHKKPLIWSTRGASLATHQWKKVRKKWIKRGFEHIANFFLDRNLSYVHVTSDLEADVAKKVFPSASRLQIPNPVPDVEPPKLRIRSPQDDVRILFLSRLHPMKGINELLEAISLLPEKYKFDIAGSADPNYLKM